MNPPKANPLLRLTFYIMNPPARIQFSENELLAITTGRGVPTNTTDILNVIETFRMSSHSLSSSSNSNLNSLLKNQIKNAVATLYDEQGTAAANRYSHPDELSKALLDLLFPDEAAENTEITGVAKVPTEAEATAAASGEAKSDSEGSTDSKKERKKRAPMSDEAKAAMKAKREATIAAKKGTALPPAPASAEPAPEAPAPEVPAKKAKKTKAAAPAPAANPIIAEVDKVIAPVEPEVAEAPASDDAAESKKDRKPRGPMSDEAKAAMKAKREATIAAKKAAQA